MSLPANGYQVQGQGVVTADQLNTLVQWTTNVSTLRKFVGIGRMQVYLQGLVTIGDGGQGDFYWNATSLGPDNGTSIIVPNGVAMGAWVRIASLSPENLLFVANLTALRALSTSAFLPNQLVYMEGYASAGDGGGGMFVATTVNPGADNGGTIVWSSTAGTYYLRQYSPQSIDARWFGVFPGTTDNGVPINAAIVALGRGILILPAGTLSYSTPLALNGKTDVTIKGQGGVTAGGAPGTGLRYTGTGSTTAINMASSIGCWFMDVQFVYSSASFTGKLIANSGGFYCGVERVSFFGAGAINTADCFIDLDQSQNFTVRVFAMGAGGLRAAIAGPSIGHFCTNVHISEGEFSGCITPPISNCGDEWLISNVAFERLTSGVAGAFAHYDARTSRGLTFLNCFFGDVTVGGGTWISARNANAFTANGCQFGGSGSADGTIGVALQATLGFTITGNSFESIGTAISLSGSCSQQNIAGNEYTGVGVQVATPSAMAGYATPGYEITPSGIVRQWGTSSVTTGTPLVITLPFASMAVLYAIKLTLLSPTGAGNTTYATSASATAFSANVNGTAGANSVYWEVTGGRY